MITGVAALGTGPDLGRLGGKTLAFYVITTLIAVLIALVLVNLVEPGVQGRRAGAATCWRSPPTRPR